MDIVLKTGELFLPSAMDIEVWRITYPEIDIDHEIQRMACWCYSNPSNRKAQRGIRRFINSWLSREHNRIQRDARRRRDPTSTRGTTLAQDLSDTSWAT